jgi:hypothetical protein
MHVQSTTPGGGGGVCLESYTREARFLTRWDQHEEEDEEEKEEEERHLSIPGEAHAAIFCTTSSPLTTRPTTTCLPSHLEDVSECVCVCV